METRPEATESRKPAARTPEGRHGWTLVFLSIGVAIIACCFLLPEADESRRLLYEKDKLARDLQRLEMQAAANDEFLKRIGSDPALAERLAQRQIGYVREGSAILRLNPDEQRQVLTPFTLVTAPEPPPAPVLVPAQGILAAVCRNEKTRLYLIGAGLMLLAMGLVLGHAPRE